MEGILLGHLGCCQIEQMMTSQVISILWHGLLCSDNLLWFHQQTMAEYSAYHPANTGKSFASDSRLSYPFLNYLNKFNIISESGRFLIMITDRFLSQSRLLLYMYFMSFGQSWLLTTTQTMCWGLFLSFWQYLSEVACHWLLPRKKRGSKVTQLASVPKATLELILLSSSPQCL